MARRRELFNARHFENTWTKKGAYEKRSKQKRWASILITSSYTTMQKFKHIIISKTWVGKHLNSQNNLSHNLSPSFHFSLKFRLPFLLLASSPFVLQISISPYVTNVSTNSPSFPKWPDKMHPDRIVPSRAQFRESPTMFESPPSLGPGYYNPINL